MAGAQGPTQDRRQLLVLERALGVPEARGHDPASSCGHLGDHRLILVAHAHRHTDLRRRGRPQRPEAVHDRELVAHPLGQHARRRHHLGEPLTEAPGVRTEAPVATNVQQRRAGLDVTAQRPQPVVVQAVGPSVHHHGPVPPRWRDIGARGHDVGTGDADCPRGNGRQSRAAPVGQARGHDQDGHRLVHGGRCHRGDHLLPTGNPSWTPQ